MTPTACRAARRTAPLPAGLAPRAAREAAVLAPAAPPPARLSFGRTLRGAADARPRWSLAFPASPAPAALRRRRGCTPPDMAS